MNWNKELSEMIEYQEQQEAAGKWEKKDDKEKPPECKSDD